MGAKGRVEDGKENIHQMSWKACVNREHQAICTSTVFRKNNGWSNFLRRCNEDVLVEI